MSGVTHGFAVWEQRVQIVNDGNRRFGWKLQDCRESANPSINYLTWTYGALITSGTAFRMNRPGD